MVEFSPAMQEARGSIPGPCSHRVPFGLPGGSTGKESARNAEDLGSSPGLGRSPGEGKGCPLQYSGLEKSMDHILLGVAKSQTRLSDFHSHSHRMANPFAS